MLLKHKDVLIDVDPVGATVTMFQWRNQHVFYPRQWVGIDGIVKLRGGSFIPGPWFGDGPVLGSPKHGYIRDTLISRIKFLPTDTGNVLRLSGVVDPDQNPDLSWFRHRFEIVVTFRLTENGFVQSIGLNNKSEMTDTPMPLNFGLHPYFAMPRGIATVWLSGNKEMEIGRGWFQEKSYSTTLLARPAVVKIPGLGKVTMSVEGALANSMGTGMTYIWTDNPDYVCVEPILTYQSLFNTPKGYFLRKPLDSIETDIMFSFDPS